MAKTPAQIAKRNRPSRRDPFGTEYVSDMAKYYGEVGDYSLMPKDVKNSVIARAENIKGHADMTEKARKAIKSDVLKAKASSPNASMYDKVRAKVNEVTGFKKGGSTASKRADGCATKGKTKGRFV